LRLIRRLGEVTRARLLELTGMSRTTLFERLELLTRAGYVYEAGNTGSTGGRPAALLRFDDRRDLLLVIDLGQLHGRLSVCASSGAVLAHEFLPLDVTDTPDTLVPELISRARLLLAQFPDRPVVGVGLGVPAPVQTGTGTRWPTTTMPGWADYPVTAEFAAAWPVPFVVENDARALTLGEYQPEEDSEGSNVLLGIKYASGIGAGVVVDGHALRGSSGATGDIGHIRVSSNGPKCRCGRRGCLAAYVSGRALLRDLRSTGVRTLDDVVERLDARDREVTAAVREAAGLFGRTLTSTIQFVNPREVVLGGILGRHPVVAKEISTQIHHYTIPRIGDELTVRVGALGEEAATVGLARLVIAQAYAPERIDAILSAS
jgi:predicted NBD/HSP70 family sugar kinase